MPLRKMHAVRYVSYKCTYTHTHTAVERNERIENKNITIKVKETMCACIKLKKATLRLMDF